MVCEFETVDLWKATLGRNSDKHIDKHERLRQEYLRARDRAAILAGEIARTLPAYTVHDITHIDSLWRTANPIAGPGHDLNPLEAFVLGGAFLIHDLGMGLAAWPGGERLLRDDAWRDIVSAGLRKELGRIPSRGEIETPPTAIAEEATRERLRMRHAERAEELAEVKFRHPADAVEYYIFEDADL